MKKALIISKLKALTKKHSYVLILLIISITFFSGILGSSKILDNMHYINDMTFQSENMRRYLHESGAFPLWTPYYYSGQPFIAIPEHYLFDLNFLYILLFKNIFFAMNLAVVSYFFLAGLGMYLLVYEIIKKQSAAFIASLVFMFNSLIQNFIIPGHLNILESYALIPFVFLFTYKALHKKQWLNNSIIAALFFSMMIYAGGIIFFLYTGLIVGLYMLWNLIGSNFKKRFLKTLFISLVIGSVLIGISALKLLPVLEFTGLSNRSAGVNYQEFLGNPISLGNLWNPLVNLSYDKGFSGAIGITSFLLLMLGFLAFRKKIIIFSTLLIILSILLAAGTFIASFFYQLPGFSQIRHIERALVLFVFVVPIIVAYGFNNLVNILKKKNIKEGLIFSVVVLLLALEIVLFQKPPNVIGVVEPNDIPIINEISKDNSDFRIATFALSTPIGASGYNYYTQLGIPAVKGGGGIWISDYVQYLAVAQQVLPSKLYGILNAKYLISNKEIDDLGLSLKGTFKSCGRCAVWEAYGPYLYENNNVIPRAFLVNSSILILGNGNDRESLAYNIIIESLDPLSNVLIEDKTTLSEYSLEELNRFNNIILLRDSVAQNDVLKLQQYVDEGGKITPNILEGENSLPQNLIIDSIQNKIHKELKLKDISVNEFSIDLDGEKGWLVLSERFAHFPGWKASINNKDLIIYKADNVISAVHLDGEKGQLIFKYKPDSFKRGKIITLIAILILLLYGFYLIYSKTKK